MNSLAGPQLTQVFSSSLYPAVFKNLTDGSSLFVSRLPGTAAQPTMGASRQAATRHFLRIRARTRRARRAAGRAVPAEYPGLVGVNVNALHTV